MKCRLLVALVILAAPARAQTAPGDAPALGGRGALAVGVADEAIDLGPRPDAARPDGKGGFATAPRRLAVTVWYPAQRTAVSGTVYRYPTTPVESVPAGRVPAMVAVPGQATRDAAAAAGRWPLVVLSHGFGNRALMFSDLAEHLASKGYVVAAIDHGDLADLAVSRPLAFLNNVIHRAADQRLVIAELARRAGTGAGVWGHADGARIALVGYSMGGFGALATAGAAYDAASPLFAQTPPGTAALLAQTPPPPPALKALIAFAPWGGAPPPRAFTAAGLARMAVPSLFIAGDADDVSDYAGGIRWLFEQAGAPRALLTYQNARHNVATNATPAMLADRFEYVERQDEPVWRKDRMLAINVHFITAFLDWRLKGDTGAARWLAVPSMRAADGQWPLAPGETAADRTDGPPQHWPGFQRRWALGLMLETRP
jgi:predicted dienelactone hydrolase